MNKYLVMAVIVGIALTFTGYKAYHLGKKVERNEWLVATAKQAEINIETLSNLHEEAREKEALANVLLNNTSDKLREAQNEINNRNSVINKQYRDITRLQFDLSAERTAASEARATAISSRDCDGEKIVELSENVSRFIYDRFGECDAIVEQLTAAQEILKIDREVHNE